LGKSLFKYKFSVTNSRKVLVIEIFNFNNNNLGPIGDNDYKVIY